MGRRLRSAQSGGRQELISASSARRRAPANDRVDDSMAERRLLKAAARGDANSFEGLYRLHEGRVYALCLRMCGNVPEAEEMTQEAFVRCWRSLSSFKGESAFGSWLHRLVVNTVLSSRRAGGRYRDRVTAVPDLQAVGQGAIRSTPDHGVDLERAIARLPEGARTIFVLHDIEGWKHREIAEQTGLAVGTCKTHLHRARKQLRAALGGAGTSTLDGKD